MATLLLIVLLPMLFAIVATVVVVRLAIWTVALFVIKAVVAAQFLAVLWPKARRTSRLGACP